MKKLIATVSIVVVLRSTWMIGHLMLISQEETRLVFSCFATQVKLFSNSETNNRDNEKKKLGIFVLQLGIAQELVAKQLQRFRIFVQKGMLSFWSATHKSLPIVQINVGFYFKVTTGKMFLSGFSYTKSYIKLYAECISGKNFCISCGKESQGSNQSFLA